MVEKRASGLSPGCHQKGKGCAVEEGSVHLRGSGTGGAAEICAVLGLEGMSGDHLL